MCSTADIVKDNAIDRAGVNLKRSKERPQACTPLVFASRQLPKHDGYGNHPYYQSYCTRAKDGMAVELTPLRYEASTASPQALIFPLPHGHAYGQRHPHTSCTPT